MSFRQTRIFVSFFAIACSIGQCDLAVHAETPTTIDAVQIGIEGHCRVGCWTGIRYLGSDAVTAIETRDGDGVRVVYRQQPEAGWSYVIPGSEAAPLVIHGKDDVIRATRFPTLGSPARGVAMIPREMKWVVVFGDPMGIDTIGANKLLGRDAKIAVSKPQSPATLPDSVLGYDGLDMLVISGSGAGLLGSLSGPQQSAIRDWITGGGYVFLTLGESGEQLLAAAPWLLELLPVDQVSTVMISPSAVETHTTSTTPLDSFMGIRLPRDRGRIMVMGRTTRRLSLPIAAEYNVGFGRMVVVAADLDDEMFAVWPERLDLITQLTGTMLMPEVNEVAGRSRRTAYDDLAGQLRASLDQFSTRGGFGFSIVSLIMLALIAAIGPLDYLLINRLLGRPLLGWITFPLVVIAFSIALVWQARPMPASSMGDAPQEQANDMETKQIEIFDIDAVEGTGRGFAARYFYSHAARSVDISVTADDVLRSVSDDIQLMITAPLGTPGQAFGGIPIAIEDARMPAYEVRFQRSQSDMSSQLVALPIASRSSKGIVSQCRFTPKLAKDVALRRRPGSELLDGGFVNPLPVDLMDGMLVFRNWAYRLPTRFAAGASVASVADLRQKNFRWQLSRQQALEESETRTEAWDPTMVDSLERVAEMLMFHEAAGGTRYTTLRNDPLSSLDLSHVLSDDRCILIGRLASSLTKSETTKSDLGQRNATGRSATKHPPVAQRSGQSLSLIRVVLPVQP